MREPVNACRPWIPPGVDLRDVMATFQALTAVGSECRRARQGLGQREGSSR
jgi:hypothetical protein